MTTWSEFEKKAYSELKRLLNDGKLLVSPDNAEIFLHKKYFSVQRQDYIKMDITIEKYFDSEQKYPALILVFECKDYNGSIPVDDVEEFHAKLQQIGPDNTKGFILTRNGSFQKSAISYAKANGISLATISFCKQLLIILCGPSGLPIHRPKSPDYDSRSSHKMENIVYVKDCIETGMPKYSLQEYINRSLEL